MNIKYQQESIAVDEVMKFFALIGQSYPLCLEMIKNREVAKKAVEIGLVISDEQLQEYADNYRISMGLGASRDMFAFLGNAGLTEDDFESFCESVILTEKLKERLADDIQIEEHFVNSRAEYDQARISVILVREEPLANELLVRITEEGEDFHNVAREFSFDEQTRYAGGYAGMVSRRMLPAAVAAKVFAAGYADVVGPFDLECGFQLVLVEEVRKAELNDAVRQKIKEKIFGEWLSQFVKNGVSIVA